MSIRIESNVPPSPPPTYSIIGPTEDEMRVIRTLLGQVAAGETDGRVFGALHTQFEPLVLAGKPLPAIRFIK